MSTTLRVITFDPKSKKSGFDYVLTNMYNRLPRDYKGEKVLPDGRQILAVC